MTTCWKEIWANKERQGTAVRSLVCFVTFLSAAPAL